MPLKQVSGQWQLSSTLSLSAQYLLDWKPFRLVPGGTYFAVGSSADGVSAACGRVLPPAFGAGSCMRFLEDITPGRSGGDFGVALRWTPDWLDGTAGFYYRKYDEKMPWSATQYGGGSPNLLANTGVRMNYARNTELFGFSLAKSIGGISVGAELSYRHNTALNSVNGYFIGTGGDTPVTAASFGAMLPNIAVPLAQTPGYSAAEGARGNTMHAVLNGIWLMPRTPLWKTGTLQAELTYQRLDSVTRNSNLFYSDSYACKFGYGAAGIAPGSRGKKDGCATRDAWGFALGFTPEWPQAFAGWDLSLPISFSIGLKGNSPAIGGVNEGVYKYAIGVKGKYRSQHEFGLTWMDSYAHYKTEANPSNGVGQTVATQVGSNAVQNHHGLLIFTFKTSF